MKFLVLFLLSLSLTLAFATEFNRLKNGGNSGKRLRKQSKHNSQLSSSIALSLIPTHIIDNGNIGWLIAKADTITTTAVASSSVGFVSKLIESYSLALGRNPLKVKMISTGIISSLGDIICQTIEMNNDDGKTFDFHRLSVFSSVGFFYIAPLLHWWFNVLNTIPSKLFGTNITNFMNATTMIFIDQSVASFVVLSGFFFFYELFNSVYSDPINAFKFEFIEKATTAWKTGLFPTLKANWVFWPFVNFFCFLLIPVKFQLLFSNIMATFWNIYLSKASSEASG